jgi:PAS domain S-box-containing protein
MERSFKAEEQQRVLNALMRIGLEDLPLNEQLECILEEVLAHSPLDLLPQGGIFLVEGDSLVLQATRALPEGVRILCARVPLGRCLCGRAAQSGRIEFASSIDERHEHRYEGMSAHGHYTVPIRSGERLLGVMVLYLREGHRRDRREERFLLAVADTLAMIIERKRAEEALRASEAKFRGLFENVFEGVYQTTPEGRLLMANPALVHMLGYDSEEEVLEADVRDFYADPKDRELFKRRLEEEGELRNAEFVLKRKDGRKIVVLENARVVRDEHGRVLYYEGMLTDITERAELERLKAEFIAMISHDLRSPLTSIKGYVDLLLSGDAGPLSEGQRRLLEIIAQNTTRLTNLVEDLLEIERLESGGVELKRVEVDLHELLQEVAESFRLSVEDKGLKLKVELASGLIVLGDRERLAQVFANLLSNAIKYTPEGEVCLRAYRDEEGCAVVEVSDTGIGLTPEETEQVFERFFRSSHEYARRAGGSGLGLAIAKTLVTQHGGEISATGRPGKGSTFTVRLPLLKPRP